MLNDLIDYIHINFPNFWNDINIRFELGEPYDNGTDERINQVVKRVTILFEEIFHPDDDIHLFVKDWENETDIMFGNTTPNYLYELLSQHKIDETIMCEQDEDIDETGNTIKIEKYFKVKSLSGVLSSIPYKEILIGIANYEQGREPSIGQNVYFISLTKNIVFYMYDDRGCVIFAKEKERLRNLYVNYNDWLVDYWRKYFDDLYTRGNDL